LLRIYALAEFNRFGLTREVVIAEILDYLKSAGAETEVAAQMSSESNGNAGHPTTPQGTQNPQEYASYLLRRLGESGWIEREQHADYTETIILPNHTFTLLEAFRAIQDQKPREFSGQLYTAHQLLTAASDRDDFSPALAITQAFENVRQVMRGLNELNQNIRRYIERATRTQDPSTGAKTSVSDLLHLQFDDYAETLGPTYHALKTSDHVSRYRRDIVNQLQQWQFDGKWLDCASEELATQGDYTPAQASEEITRSMQFIIHQLESLDPLLDDIDRRHAQYLHTSLRHIRYQLVSADGSFKDKLVNLAKHLDALQEKGETLLPEDAPGLQRHPVDQPDMRSFYTPPQNRGAFIPAKIITPKLRPSELAALHTATMQDVTQALTPDKINRFVMGFFNGHKKLHTNDLPLDILNNLQWLTTIIAYAHHPEVAYGIESVDGQLVEVGSYRIVPFELEKF
jgi:hypothetical protein